MCGARRNEGSRFTNSTPFAAICWIAPYCKRAAYLAFAGNYLNVLKP